MQVKPQLEPDMEQQTGFKLGKEYIKAVYCYPAYLTYMQSTACKMLGWMKQNLESRLQGEISIVATVPMTDGERLGLLVDGKQRTTALTTALENAEAESTF